MFARNGGNIVAIVGVGRGGGRGRSVYLCTLSLFSAIVVGP
jgi:hypothetical protein